MNPQVVRLSWEKLAPTRKGTDRAAMFHGGSHPTLSVERNTGEHFAHLGAWRIHWASELLRPNAAAIKIRWGAQDKYSVFAFPALLQLDVNTQSCFEVT
mmetsp:Transcript_3958/g.12610  ORF Transcript_3958/g.12610 Transcript_3958/m.12610 type:complete len:99 (+) Transcript_3958:619-915(+)